MTDDNDVFGKGLWQYHKSPNDQELITWTNLTFEDSIPSAIFSEHLTKCLLWKKRH
jgi:hypothetical protein